MPNIILTGFMASGKTSAGPILAEQLDYTFADTDSWIEAQTGMSIAGMFASQGEAAFRRWEGVAARHFRGTDRHVIATGGGMLLDAANAIDLAQTGPIICLTASPETILQRVQSQGGARPLLDVPDPAAEAARLLAERAEGYGRFPLLATDGKTPQQVASELRAGLEFGRWQRPLPTDYTLPVTYPGSSYPVHVGRGLLPRLRALAGDPSRLALITDVNVGSLYVDQVGADEVITLPAGEQHKTLDTVRGIYEAFLEAGIERSATVATLGGGVIGDMGGFAAASYMRGLPLAQCPTTLLAMVDASVGGKTGVDLPQGKNLVGAFKQPEAVLADVDTLDTLPAAEFSAGMAEVIKHGLIASPALLRQIREGDVRGHGLVSLLLRAIPVKIEVVESDPFEAGRRAILNLGHTFGHAIEQASGYGVRHGEAVAMGLVCAAHLSAKLGHCRTGLQGEVERLLEAVQLPARIPGYLPAEKIFDSMGADKKKKGGKLRFVLMREVGDIFVTADVPREAVLETIQALRM